MKRALLILGVLLLVGGCLQPIQKLGCCLKDNVTAGQGCVLYNTTDPDQPPRDLTGATNGLCDDEASGTKGHCNVTIGSKTHLIPICSQDDLATCTDPNCTVMVCGEFTFKPRVAPSITSSDEDDIQEQGTPPNVDDEAAAIFYKAACRFLPMDADLRNVMQTTKSKINVFRVGVGGSFDAYDQYRYYFPMSDRYCSADPAMEKPIDRYMNYINPTSLETFDPVHDLESNCFDESDVPPPMSYMDPPLETASGYLGGVAYWPSVPEFHNYRFSQYMTYNGQAYYGGDGVYWYNNYYWNNNGLFKKIDKEFYRKELSIAHAETIYDTADTGATRAPYECEVGQSNCWSGTCDIQFYNRGVLVATEEASGISNIDDRPDVITDCVETNDENGNKRVVCLPTKDVTTYDDGKPPYRDYAKVPVALSHIEIETGGGHLYKYDTLADEEGEEEFKVYWYEFYNIMNILATSESSKSKTSSYNYQIVNVPYDISYEWMDKEDCDSEYPGVGHDDDDAHDDVACPVIYQWDPEPSNSLFPMGMGPVAGGAVFFGKLEGDNEPQPSYNGKTVIGYALAKESEFQDTMLAKNCNLVEGEDYTVLEIGSPTYWDDIDELYDTFAAYFDDAIERYKATGFDDGCGSRMNAVDAVIASTPWIIAYEKGILQTSKNYDELTPLLMTSTPGFVARERNVYDQLMNPINETSSCVLRLNNDYSMFHTEYYNIVFSKQLILFNYEPGSGKMGSCTVEDATYLPKVRTFGWCEPCTQSTLALQKITAEDRVYLPSYLVDLHQEPSYGMEQLCMVDYFFNGSIWQVQDNVSCMESSIPDLKDYGGSAMGFKGAPRTDPDAAVMKLRLYEYMSSGVLPVIDISDPSNWDLENPDHDEDNFFSIFDITPENYSHYDWEALLGTMGAVVTVVDNVDAGGSPADIAANAETIMDRGSLVRAKCYGCMPAFHVKNIDSPGEFNTTIGGVLPKSASHNIDIITIEYSVSDHPEVSANGATAVVEDIAKYGRASLQKTGKPVMITAFNVRDDDPYWGGENAAELFDEIILSQDELVQAGIIGIIYTPSRSSSTTDESLVQTIGFMSWQYGTKKPKFCALQEAVQKLSATAPISMFNRINAQENITCEACSAYDLVPGGRCSMPLVDPMVCDDGSTCTIPEMALAVNYKCPENIVSMDCPICNQSSSTFTCTKTWANGTVDEFSGNMSELNSGIWVDILGGFPRPEKCCIFDQEANVTYTFTQMTMQSPVNQPLVYPKSGENDTDCGIGASFSDLGETDTFCSIQQQPIQNFMIECHED